MNKITLIGVDLPRAAQILNTPEGKTSLVFKSVSEMAKFMLEYLLPTVRDELKEPALQEFKDHIGNIFECELVDRTD